MIAAASIRENPETTRRKLESRGIDGSVVDTVIYLDEEARFQRGMAEGYRSLHKQVSRLIGGTK